MSAEQKSTLPTEESIAAIWSEVLGEVEVLPDSDFFGLGGNSLKMMNMIFRVGETFNVDLDPGALFDNSSLRQFTLVVVAMVQESQTEETLRQTL